MVARITDMNETVKNILVLLEYNMSSDDIAEELHCSVKLVEGVRNRPKKSGLTYEENLLTEEKND